MFTRNEDFKTFTRYYPIVSIIIAIHTLLFTIFYLDVPLSRTLFNALVGRNDYIALGEYYRLLTPIFVHVQFKHYLFNTFSLFLFGPALERMLGPVKFIIAYIGAGLFANVVCFFLLPLSFSHIGASGAIFGLFGIYVYLIVFKKRYMSDSDQKIILTVMIIGVIMSFFTRNVNVLGHLAGLVGGFLLGFVLFIKHKAKPIYVPNYSDYDDGDIHFDPNRWKKRRLHIPSKVLKPILWGVFIFLMILGLLSKYM